MGAERADVVVALQHALLRAAGEFGDEPSLDHLRPRILATAAALDYVLMLTRGAAGTRIPKNDAERAIRDGVTRAVDDLIDAATAIVRGGGPGAGAFARDAAQALQRALRTESLGGDDRRFAVIALANT